MCSSAPDMSGLADAAKSSAKVGQDALDFYKAQYEAGAPDRAKATELAQTQAELQNQLSQQQIQTSGEERQRYLDTFAPIEQKIASDAMNYDTPARRDAAAAAARSDVQQELTGQEQATQRAMARTGVTPGSGRAMAMQGMMDIGAAKAKAGAANAARQQIETVGSAKMMDAAGLGKGVVSNQSTMAGIALNAGNSAVSNGQVPLSVAAQGAAMMGQGFQTGLQGYGQAGNLYAQQANIQASNSAANSSAMAGAGSAIGGVAMAV